MIGYNPLLAKLGTFMAMSDGQRRAEGRAARKEAAEAGYKKPGKKVTVTLPDKTKSRITLFLPS